MTTFYFIPLTPAFKEKYHKICKIVVWLSPKVIEYIARVLWTTVLFWARHFLVLMKCPSMSSAAWQIGNETSTFSSTENIKAYGLKIDMKAINNARFFILGWTIPLTSSDIWNVPMGHKNFFLFTQTLHLLTHTHSHTLITCTSFSLPISVSLSHCLPFILSALWRSEWKKM